MTKPKHFNDERAAKAQKHIQEMSKKFSKEILSIVSESTIYMNPLNNKDDKNMIKNTKYLCFRYDIEKLRGEWLLKYKNKDGSSRGYPDIIYQTIEKKED